MIAPLFFSFLLKSLTLVASMLFYVSRGHDDLSKGGLNAANLHICAHRSCSVVFVVNRNHSGVQIKKAKISGVHLPHFPLLSGPHVGIMDANELANLLPLVLVFLLQ